MSWPQTPTDGQSYVTPLGTTYIYRSLTNSWDIQVSNIGVTGIQGLTGIQGQPGLQGQTGIQGQTGLQGQTGIQGQGVTGLQGQGVTGSQGATGFSFGEYQNTMGAANLTVDWNNGLKQSVNVNDASSGSYNIGFANGATGLQGSCRIYYTFNQAPGVTGCYWPGAVRPSLSGYTGVQDYISVYQTGTKYIAQAALYIGLA